MPWARTLDNARLPLDLEGMNRTKANGLALRALARVGLADLRKLFPVNSPEACECASPLPEHSPPVQRCF
jgi:hypothetical protein